MNALTCIGMLSMLFFGLITNTIGILRSCGVDPNDVDDMLYPAQRITLALAAVCVLAVTVHGMQ